VLDTDAPPDAPPDRRTPPGWRREALALGVVVVVLGIPLRGLLRAPGPPMEEGFMLVFPERVLHGDIPNRDFLHLYGPGSLWALATAFKVFGVSLWTERVFGLLQQLAIVFSIYALARRWNRALAAGCAVCSTLIIVPFGLAALAWVGAVGAGMAALVFGMQSIADRGSGRVWATLAGLAFAVALLFRPDLVIAVGLSTFVLWRAMDRGRRVRMVWGFALAPAMYVVHFAMAGFGNAWRGLVLDPVFNLRGGRSLPVPPSWSHLDGFLQRAGALQEMKWPIPGPLVSQQLFLWFFLLLACVAFLLTQGILAIRAEPMALRSRTLLLVSVFSVGILPQAIQRVDSAHFQWVSCVPFAFLPVAIYESLHRRAPYRSFKRFTVIGLATTLAVMFFFFPAFTATRYADYAAQTFNRHRQSFRIQNGDRTFYYGKEDRAQAAQMVIDEANRIATPGQRLFVGPVNLRKTPYSDAYLYYMLPKLRPGTYYIEMDPMDTKPDSGLDKQLANSDVAILSSIWDAWDEPNDSGKLGSDKTQKVLDDHFCQVGNYLDLYRLYRRCR
jgi:hypothetical protein